MKYRELIEKLKKMDKTEFANYIDDNTENMINTEDGLYGKLFNIPFECMFSTEYLIKYLNLEDKYNKIKDNDEKYDFMEELSRQYQLNEEEIDKHFIGEKQEEIINELEYQIEYELDKDLEDEI